MKTTHCPCFTPVRSAGIFLLFSAACLSAAPGLLREVGSDLASPPESQLTGRPSFFGPLPSADILRNPVSSPTYAGSYGTGQCGCVIPPATGDCILWESGSDTVAGYFSISEIPNLKRLIVAHGSYRIEENPGIDDPEKLVRHPDLRTQITAKSILRK